MIDHVTIYVSNLEASLAFYEAALSPLGYKILFGEKKIFWAFDIGNKCLFEIAQYKGNSPITPCHIAFRASSKNQIEAFYAAAISAGATDNGAPGPRPQYTEGYYACFVRDPDAHNIEAMIDLTDAKI